MYALQSIDFKGSNILINSFDSSDPAHDDPLDPNEVKAGADLATVTGFVNVGNAVVKGKLRIGPTGGYTIGPTGSVGDLDWTGPGIQVGWYSTRIP